MNIKLILATALFATIGLMSCEKEITQVKVDNEINQLEKSLIEVKTNQFLSFKIPFDLQGDLMSDVEVLTFSFESQTEEGLIYQPQIRAGFTENGGLKFVEISHEFATLIGYDNNTIVDFFPDDGERRKGLWKRIKVFLVGEKVCGVCIYGLKNCWRKYPNGRTGGYSTESC